MRESRENYLETILILKQKSSFVRSIDVANELGFTKPSISRAMSILKKEGLIEIETDGNIVLTTLGKQKASEVYTRHVTIRKYLILTLGLDEATAEQDACRIEHILSDITFEKIQKYVAANT